MICIVYVQFFLFYLEKKIEKKKGKEYCLLLF